MNKLEANPGQSSNEVGNSCFSNTRNKYIINSILGLVLMVSLYILSRLNYPLFHSIADMIVIFIAASVFIIIWSGRHLLDNQYYLSIGIAFLFFALFDFLHLLGNKGMGVFPEFGNLGPTFYIVSRYILSISFLLAPVFIKRKVKTALIISVYSLVSILVLLSIFYWQNFPVTYIEGTGLTRFKIVSDYVVGLFFLGAIGLLLHNRRAFDAKVLRLILLSLVVSIITGMAFTFYTDPFGITNAVGHFLQIASFYLVFLAFVDTGLAKPQDLLFRNLKQSNVAIQQLNTELAKVNSELINNMAELERKDLALKESEAQANSLIKYAPTAIFEFDFNRRRFISVNEAMCRMSGYTREELYILDPMSLLDEESGQALIDRLRLQQVGKEAQDAVECKVRKKDGSIMYVALNFSFSDYSPETVLVIAHDVTARRRYDDDLKRYAAELEVSNKELEAFAYSLSHDLRAPLRTLDGFSQAVLDDYGDRLDDTGKDYLLRVRTAAQNMAQITEDMLKLSKVIRNDLRWETVNLSEMVSQIAKDLSEKEPERKIGFTIAPNVFAEGDPSLLHIAIYNLIENAWKFTAKSPQALIEFAMIREDNSDVYFVKDNGIGFNMQYTDKLFLPFQRLHANTDFPGHGIGLATVQRVISRHGGKIWADSEQGKGTAIYFTLGNYGKES